MTPDEMREFIVRLRRLATAMGDIPMSWTLLEEAAALERDWLNEHEETT